MLASTFSNERRRLGGFQTWMCSHLDPVKKGTKIGEECSFQNYIIALFGEERPILRVHTEVIGNSTLLSRWGEILMPSQDWLIGREPSADNYRQIKKIGGLGNIPDSHPKSSSARTNHP